jgi:hypothetical protein
VVAERPSALLCDGHDGVGRRAPHLLGCLQGVAGGELALASARNLRAVSLRSSMIMNEAMI